MQKLVLMSFNNIIPDTVDKRVIVGIADARKLIHLIYTVHTGRSRIGSHRNRLSSAEYTSSPAGHHFNEVIMCLPGLDIIKKICCVPEAVYDSYLHLTVTESNSRLLEAFLSSYS